MRIRIVTFRLNIPAEDYLAHAVHLAPRFTQWPGLVAKWWLGETDTGTYGGVYLFASREAADRSRTTEVFQEMLGNPALAGINIVEYDVLAAPTSVTAPYAAAEPR